MGNGGATSQQRHLFEDYDGFVEKFKPKKTTDDCVTPPSIYDIVADYVAETEGVDRSRFVRPFWPGGDYESFDYPVGAIVVDNPPFSMLSKIREFYIARGIPFWLFCPTLTAFSGKCFDSCSFRITGAKIIYENGASIPTSFVTSFRAGEIAAESDPVLSKLVTDEIKRLRSKQTADVPTYSYPDNLTTAAHMQLLARRGQRLTIRRGECIRVSALDSQRAAGKGVFGSGLLVSDRVAADRVAADRAAADRAAADRANVKMWDLSERERDIVDRLNRAGATA